MVDSNFGRMPAPPWGTNLFQHYAVFRKFWQIVCWHPRGLAPPPRENPGYATAKVYYFRKPQLLPHREARNTVLHVSYVMGQLAHPPVNPCLLWRPCQDKGWSEGGSHPLGQGL